MNEDIRTALNATANQILAVVAPDTARLVQAHVLLEDDDDTASTDGIRIWLPLMFEGIDVTANAKIAVGLLVHELGHFLQPLDALDQVEREVGAPHWLVNIIADIQLEAMMSGLFPPLADTLVAVRTAVNQARLTDYQDNLRRSRSLVEAAAPAALIGRYAEPYTPFSDVNKNGILADNICQHPNLALSYMLYCFARYLLMAKNTSPDKLADLVRYLMAQLPELRHAIRPPEPSPGGRSVIGPIGKSVQAEASKNTGKYTPAHPAPVDAVSGQRLPPREDARRIARALRMHFQSIRGASEIVAPGYLNRRAAVLGEPVPLRMTLPGREVPRPRVVICLDKSASMCYDKFNLAQTAAQAVALAIEEIGGEVVGVLFDNCGQVGASDPGALLFADPKQLRYGSTDFTFLTDVWRRWPGYTVLLVTDGDGPVPFALPTDKARTHVILIPPEDDPDAMRQIATQVVRLTSLRGLANVLALLTPYFR